LNEVCEILFLRNNLTSLSFGVTLPNKALNVKSDENTFTNVKIFKSNATGEETAENVPNMAGIL